MKLDKNILRELITNHISYDDDEVIINGLAYRGRFGSPSRNTVMRLAGYDMEVKVEFRVYIPKEDKKPESLDTVTVSDSGEVYKILEIVEDAARGTDCYTIQLGDKR